MQRGQAAELRALEDERKAARRSRGDARALEARLVQKEFDLRAKHREEADLLDASVLGSFLSLLSTSTGSEMCCRKWSADSPFGSALRN